MCYPKVLVGMWKNFVRDLADFGTTLKKVAHPWPAEFQSGFWGPTGDVLAITIHKSTTCTRCPCSKTAIRVTDI